ncbi:MAG: hypothetical protein P0S95_06705 [Rhabdochlamydiaceae bacterium]|nr:hypothetical protein [Candidatus Amphrikana amoebophyrae]
MHTVVLRHRKENIKKCSLSGLEEDANFTFFRYPTHIPSNLENTILLTIDAPELTKEDNASDLLLIDGTWKYAAIMEEQTLKVNPNLIKRSLPANIRTAYPRKQTGCIDEQRGLASIEALAIAQFILGNEWEYLLDRYHWKEQFLTLNKAIFQR